MEAARRCLRSNALFLMILLASVGGHSALIWLRVATAFEPQFAQLESGRNSISVRLIAQPAPLEAIEPLTLDKPVPISDTPIRAPEMTLVRSVQRQDVTQAEPDVDGWEPIAAAAPPPVERRADAAVVPAEPAVAEPTPQQLERQPSEQTVALTDASVEVPETLISEQATGSDVPPSFASRPLPAYPERLLLRRIEGIVQLLVTIDSAGRVSALSLHVSSGYPEMDESALRSVRMWTFTPARRGNVAVEKTVLVPVRFTIRSQGS